jgi:4-hydroxythreonine-4-phosphate dehydrogenase
MGDPCGIGPEIIAKAWLVLKDRPELSFCVVGDAETLSEQNIPTVFVTALGQGQDFSHALPVYDQPLMNKAVAGQPTSNHGQSIIDWIKTAVEFCTLGQARALVTAPIAKSVLYASGFSYPGHTEYLQALTGSQKSVMMLAAKDLRVVLTTIHLPLKAAIARLDPIEIEAAIRITHAALKRDFGIAEPRLVMAALNPHAGEEGSLGLEEIEVLRPLVKRLAAVMNISGPLPADSLFHDEARTKHDAVICLYHDQGLIPLKTIDFWGGVNITLGLPIIRTSPDHGTGFDIAGKGLARPDSLIKAIETAHEISLHRC